MHCAGLVREWSRWLGRIGGMWWRLCPARRNKDGSPAELTEFELNSIGNDTNGIREKAAATVERVVVHAVSVGGYCKAGEQGRRMHGLFLRQPSRSRQE